MNFLSRLFALLVSGSLVTGCLNFGAAPGGIEAPEELASGVKNLVVYRRPAFFLDNKPVFLTLDGIDIAKIRVNEYVEVGLGEGRHILGARCSTSQRPLTREWRMVEHEVTVYEDGRMQFIELGPCQFTDKDQQAAKRQIGNYAYRPLKDGVSVRLRDWMAEYNRRVDEQRAVE